MTALLAPPRSFARPCAAAGTTFLFYSVDWSFYDGLIELMGNGRVRVTYDRGSLELISPSFAHESAGKLIGRFIETAAEEFAIPLKGCKSTTFRKMDLDRGLEPDESYYTDNLAAIAGRSELDLSVDPPPDIAIEIDITRSSLNRMSIYAALGIPEVWRYDGEKLEFTGLGAGSVSYTPRTRSTSFPMIDPNIIASLLSRRFADDDTTLVREFRRWLRTSATPPAGETP